MSRGVPEDLFSFGFIEMDELDLVTIFKQGREIAYCAIDFRSEGLMGFAQVEFFA